MKEKVREHKKDTTTGESETLNIQFKSGEITQEKNVIKIILPPGKGAGTAMGPAKVQTMACVKITKLKTKTILAMLQDAISPSPSSPPVTCIHLFI